MRHITPKRRKGLKGGWRWNEESVTRTRTKHRPAWRKKKTKTRKRKASVKRGAKKGGVKISKNTKRLRKN